MRWDRAGTSMRVMWKRALRFVGPGAEEDEFDRHFRCQRWADRWMNALDGVRLLLSWAEIEVAADEPVRCEKSMATFFPAWLRIV